MNPKIEILLAMFIFGSVGIFVRYAQMPSANIVFVRAFCGALVLLAASIAFRQKLRLPVIKKNLLLLVASGTILGFNWLFLFKAFELTSVSIAIAIDYLAPVLVMLSAPFVLKEKLSMVHVCCICLSLVGTTMVSGVWDQDVQLGQLKGAFFAFIGAILYALLVLANKKLKGTNVFESCVVQLGAAAATILPFVTVLADTPFELPSSGLALASLAMLGFVHTGLAYLLYFGSLPRLSGQTVALLCYLEPVVGIALSALVLKEPCPPLQILGSALILGSTIYCEIKTSGAKKTDAGKKEK